MIGGIESPGRIVDCKSIDEPRQLWPDDVKELRLDRHPRLTPAHASDILRLRPGASFWIPATGEFMVVTPWRHRRELLTVHSSGAFGNEDALLRAALAQAQLQGAAGFVMVDLSETRSPAFYERHGFRRFEDIVTFEHRRPATLASAKIPDELEFVRIDGSDPALLCEVQDLDRATFPWFWWNSPDEFDAYLAIPDVELWAGLRNNKVVTYSGTTRYWRWAHLDRIATHPTLQGLGLGRATLLFAVRSMVRQGCREVVLSTQGNNPRSRSLYQQTGFVRTPVDDYSIFVAPFDESRVYAGMATDEAQSSFSGDRNSSCLPASGDYSNSQPGENPTAPRWES